MLEISHLMKYHMLFPLYEQLNPSFDWENDRSKHFAKRRGGPGSIRFSWEAPAPGPRAAWQNASTDRFSNQMMDSIVHKGGRACDTSSND